MAMDRTSIIEWIQESFKPLTLAVPDTTISLCVDNAISYWNTHSAYKTVEMVDYNVTDGGAVQVPKKIKTVDVTWIRHIGCSYTRFDAGIIYI